MASKKYRPIVMNRNKRPGKTYTIIKRAILITAILACIEVIILVVIHFRNKNKPVANTRKNVQEVAKVVRDSLKPTVVNESKVIAENKQKPADTMKKTNEPIKPVAEKPEIPVQKDVEDTPDIQAIKPKEVKVVRTVSNEKMFQILNEVRLKKMVANNPSKCVSIQIINSDNAENGSRIATYFRNNGYVISGREVISGSQKGIQIDATGSCISLAIGSL